MTMVRRPATETPFSSSMRKAVWMTERSAVVSVTSVLTRFPAVTARRNSTSSAWSVA